MFTDKLLVFLEIMVIRPCFTQELSFSRAVGNAPAGAPGYGPAWFTCRFLHTQANWWPQDFTPLMCFTLPHSSLFE